MDAATRTKITPREMEVLRLILKYKSRAEVATYLYISERTVDFHVEQIRDKLELLIGFDKP